VKPTKFEVYPAHEMLDPDFAAGLAEAKDAIAISFQIYDLRRAARMSQARLAKLAGTTQQVISRVEGADYRSHSRALLERIAEALGATLQLRLVPKPKPRAKAKRAVPPRRAATKSAKEHARPPRAGVRN